MNKTTGKNKVHHWILQSIVFFTWLNILWAGAAADAAQSQAPEVVRTIEPLSVRGINYFPRETPWGGMWTKTPPEVFEKDMALAASLGCNTVRTFLMFDSNIERAGLINADGSLTWAYRDKLEQLLAAGWRHGIRVIVCFEFAPQWLTETNAAQWQRAMSEVVESHRGDGRVLLWDLMNEPEGDARWNDNTRAYLSSALPLIKKLDPQHLTTIGLTFRSDLLCEVGLPDVMQYHEYCAKALLFAKGSSRVIESINGQRRVGGARPLLIGEFGLSTAREPQKGAEGSLCGGIDIEPGTEAEQYRIYEIVLAAAEQSRVGGVLPWCLHDYPIKNPNEAHFGLVRDDGTFKPAALLLRKTFTRWRHQ